MSELNHQTAIITPQYYNPEIFHQLQNAIQTSLDVARKEFPVGFTFDYPYRYYHDHDDSHYYRLRIVIADYCDQIPTVYGLAPGVILQHLTASPHRTIFQYNDEGSGRYAQSKVQHYLSDDSSEGFISGLPDQFREVITPLRFHIPYYCAEHVTVMDTVEAPFFLPSRSELGFGIDDFNQPLPAQWEYFRNHPQFQFQAPEKDHLSSQGAPTSCWLRSTDSKRRNQVWVKSPNGIFSSVPYLAQSCTPFCAITKTNHRHSSELF